MSGKLYQVQNGQKVDVTPTIAALTDVSSKADVTLGNLTAAGNAALAHAAMPSDQYIDLTVPANGGAVTAPADGWYSFRGAATPNVSGWVTLRRQNDGIGFWVSSAAISGNVIGDILPVNNGDIVIVAYGAMGSLTLRFYYANGSAPQP